MKLRDVLVGLAALTTSCASTAEESICMEPRCYVDAETIADSGAKYWTVVAGHSRQVVSCPVAGCTKPQIVTSMPAVDYAQSRLFFLTYENNAESDVLVVEDNYLETEPDEDSIQWQLINAKERKKIGFLSGAEVRVLKSLKRSWVISVEQASAGHGDAAGTHYYCLSSEAVYESPLPECWKAR